MNNNLPTKSIILSATFFAATCFWANEKWYLLLPILLFAFNFQSIYAELIAFKKAPWSKEGLKYVWLTLLFIALAGLNKLLNGERINSPGDLYASFLLVPVLLFTAHYLNKSNVQVFFKTWIVFVLVETIVGLAEYLFNVRSFFMGTGDALSISSKELLYDSRVFGLSVNSSVFGLKVFIAFILLEAVKVSATLKFLMRIGLILGLLLSFNRTVIITVAVFYLLLFIVMLIRNRSKLLLFIRSNKSFQVIALSLCLIIIFRHDISFQLSRGDSTENLSSTHAKLICSDLPKGTDLKEIDELDLDGHFTSFFLRVTADINTSGRKQIWLNFFEFIDKHFLFGNGSDKLMFLSINAKTGEIDQVHAHNSYIQLLATHGILLSSLFISMLVIWWRKKNLLVLVIIALYSMTQYGIFWGMSSLDIVFVLFLIAPTNYLNLGYQKDH